MSRKSVGAKSETNGGVGGEACGLCGREVQRLTRHHLVPRTRHKKIKNKRNNKALDRQALLRTVGLCAPCHRHVHATIPNKGLEREYNTLKAHPDIGKFVEWIRRKPHGTATARTRHRADHVGSLLRPLELLRAREDFAVGRIPAEDLRGVEDDAIRDVVRMQVDPRYDRRLAP